jgi:hypothetical protein
VTSCINAAVSEHELPHYLKIAKATHCFSDAGLCPKVNAALKQSPGIRTQVLELGGTLVRKLVHHVHQLYTLTVMMWM